jgi:hypothetical protein
MAIFNFQMGQLRVTMETDQQTREKALKITEDLAGPLKEKFPDLSSDIDVQVEYLRKYHAGTAGAGDAATAAAAGKGLNDYWAANCV